MFLKKQYKQIAYRRVHLREVIANDDKAINMELLGHWHNG